jgi:DNA-binding PadR family transcriptional regulator
MSIPVGLRDRFSPGRTSPRAGQPMGLTEEAVRFCVLRLIEHAGPMNGMDIASELTPMLWLVGRGAPPPILPLLHRLFDEGDLTRSTERPPRYDITAAGRDEATRLAPYFRATGAARRERFEARVAILFADGGPAEIGPAVLATSPFGSAGGT